MYLKIYTLFRQTRRLSQKSLKFICFQSFWNLLTKTILTWFLQKNKIGIPIFHLFLKATPHIKFAVDLKTTYRLENNPAFCNGFTLGSHGEYFINQNSTKTYNILTINILDITVWVFCIHAKP
jgi:hypothetical protein